MPPSSLARAGRSRSLGGTHPNSSRHLGSRGGTSWHLLVCNAQFERLHLVKCAAETCWTYSDDCGHLAGLISAAANHSTGCSCMSMHVMYQMTTKLSYSSCCVSCCTVSRSRVPCTVLSRHTWFILLPVFRHPDYSHLPCQTDDHLQRFKAQRHRGESRSARLGTPTRRCCAAALH